MKQLDYFPFYYSYIERFSDLSDAELGRAVRAACGHGMGEEVPVTERVVSLALKTMNFDLDRAKANYAEQIERKRESGRRGAAKRWGPDPAEEAAAASARVETASAFPTVEASASTVSRTGAEASAFSPAKAAVSMVSGAEAAAFKGSAAGEAASTAFAAEEAASAFSAAGETASARSAAKQASFTAFGAEEAALTAIAAEGDSGFEALFSDGSAMVSNGKHGKSNSDSKSKSKSNSESKSKSESESESKSESKSKGKSDFFTPLPGGVGGEIQTAEDFLSLAGDDRVLRERMREYLSLLTRKRKQLTPAALRAVGRKLSSYPRDQWLEVLDQSLRNGWSDLYDLPAAGRMNPRPGGDCQAHGAPIGSLAQRAVLSMLSGETRVR